MDRHNRSIRRIIKGLGLRLESLDQSSGGHIKARVSDGSETKTVIFPVSPSDVRWEKNSVKFIRKLFNEEGQQTKEGVAQGIYIASTSPGVR